MFSRASSRCYVCFKCRRSLDLLNSSPQLATRSVQPLICTRWQSISANPARENSEDDDLVPVRPIDNHRSDDDFVQSPTKITTYRYWTPAPTVSLSVKVLGKPSEVLILPDGGRRKKWRQSESREEDRKELKPTAEHDEPQQSIFETIANETRPVSPREVSQTMENLRRHLGAPGAILDAERWSNCRETLSSAFNKAQLLLYMYQNLKPTLLDKEIEKKILNSQHMKKQRLADVIMNQIWKFERGDRRHGETTLNATVEPDHKTLILKCDKIRELALQNVRIKEVERGYQITGSDSNELVAARNAILELSRQIVSQPYVLTTDPEELQDLLGRYPIVVHRDRVSGNRVVYAFSQHDLANLERDFMLQRQTPKKVSEPSTFQSQSAGREREVPVYVQTSGFAAEEFFRTVSQGTGASHVGSYTTSRLDLALNGLLETLEDKILKARLNTLDFQLPRGDVRTVGNLSSEFSMEFGQHLVPRRLQKAELDNTEQKQPIFHSQLPLLAQFLAQRQAFDSSGNPLVKALPKSQAPTSKLFRITFIPRYPQQYPSIEIYADYGPSFRLRVQEVSLQFPSPTETVKFVTMPADFRVSRHDKLLIFRKGVGFQKQYTPLLAYFLHKLISNDEHGATGLAFSPTLELDLSCINITSDPGETEPVSDSPNDKVKYILDQVESVDRTVYYTPAPNPFLLEHLSYVPLQDSSTKEPRQVVRLVELPVLHFFKIAEEKFHDGTLRKGAEELAGRGSGAGNDQNNKSSGSDPSLWSPQPVGNDSERFAQFVRAGLDLVDSYNAFVEDKTREMVARCPSLEEQSIASNERNDAAETRGSDAEEPLIGEQSLSSNDSSVETDTSEPAAQDSWTKGRTW